MSLKIIKDADEYYLEKDGHRIGLSPLDINHFRQMTPMGRKVTLRKRAVEKMAIDPTNLEAKFILSLFHLPARDWTFLIPD